MLELPRMPVNSTHPEYDSAMNAWARARDVLGGEDAVKGGGESYLPRLDSQTDDEYDAYRRRASFFNASGRTADGFVGLIFRRPPRVKVPGQGRSQKEEGGVGQGGSALGKAMAGFVEDADMLGTSLAGYAKNVIGEVIAVGRAGSLVDWEDVEGRAYASFYTAEQIINWRVQRVAGRNVLTLLVLREVVTGGEGDEDPFEPEVVERLRVLRLGEVQSPGSKDQSQDFQQDAGNTLGCVVEVWEQREKDGGKRRKGKTEWVMVDSRTPLRLGKPLPLIPFVFHGPRHSRPDIDKLPLGDIITVNLDHYRLDADYKHGLHFTALPTAWVSGFDKTATLRIGSSTAWVSETPGASAGFLEFTGQGLTTFERAMDRDERLMAVLGSRLLEAQKRVGETAEAIELRQSGENSVLTNISSSGSESLTEVLQWAYWWHSTEDTPESIDKEKVLVELNVDFSIKGMTSEELQAVVTAWQAGAISRETMFDLFRKGEVLPEGRTNKEEAALLGATQKQEVGRQSQETTNQPETMTATKE